MKEFHPSQQFQVKQEKNWHEDLLGQCRHRIKDQKLWQYIYTWELKDLKAFKGKRLNNMLQQRRKSKSYHNFAGTESNKICIDILSMLTFYIKIHPDLYSQIYNEKISSKWKAFNYQEQIKTWQTTTKQHINKINHILEFIFDLFQPQVFVMVFPDQSSYRLLDWPGAHYNFQTMNLLNNLQAEWYRKYYGGDQIQENGGNSQNNQFEHRKQNKSRKKWKFNECSQQYRWCRFIFEHIKVQKYTRLKKQNSKRNMEKQLIDVDIQNIEEQKYYFDPEESYLDNYENLQKQLQQLSQSQIIENGKRWSAVTKVSAAWIKTPQFLNDPCSKQLAAYAQKGYLVLSWNPHCLDVLPYGIYIINIDIQTIAQLATQYIEQQKLEILTNSGQFSLKSLAVEERISSLAAELQKKQLYLYNSTDRHRLHQFCINLHLRLLNGLRLSDMDLAKIFNRTFNHLHQNMMSIVMAQYLLFQALGTKKIGVQAMNAWEWINWVKINQLYSLSVTFEDQRLNLTHKISNSGAILIPTGWQQVYEQVIKVKLVKPFLKQNVMQTPIKVQRTDKNSTKQTNSTQYKDQQQQLFTNVSRNLFGIRPSNTHTQILVQTNTNKNKTVRLHQYKPGLKGVKVIAISKNLNKVIENEGDDSSQISEDSR